MFPLTVLTLEKKVFNGEVQSLIAPGTIGYLEILINHAPIITSLQLGRLEIVDKNLKKLVYAITGGILEMAQNKAIVLADAIEAASEIDLQRAQATKEWALKHIEFPTDEISVDEANQMLLRAENRIKISQDYAQTKR